MGLPTFSFEKNIFKSLTFTSQHNFTNGNITLSGKRERDHDFRIKYFVRYNHATSWKMSPRGPKCFSFYCRSETPYHVLLLRLRTRSN